MFHWGSAFYFENHFTVNKFTQNNSLCLPSCTVSQDMFLLSIYKVFSKVYCMEWFQEPMNIFEVLVQFSFNFNVVFKKSQSLIQPISSDSEG